MSHFLQNLKKNNDGSSLLMVVIGVIFVAMIGIIMLSIATNYLLTAIVDGKSSKNFYDAESVLAEVRTGLEEAANDCSEKAYKNVVENYSADASGETRTDKFSYDYLTSLAQRLAAPGVNVTWTDTTQPLTVEANLSAVRQFVGKNDEQHENMVQAVSGSMLSLVLNKTDDDVYTLTLKNLFIDFNKKESEYRTTLQTDIVMDVPDYHLDGDSTFNELKKYIVIADDALKVNSAINADFSGNVYTGNEDDGVLISPGASVKFNSDKFITRGNVDLKSGGTLSIYGKTDLSLGDLWAENLKVTPVVATATSSDKSVFNLAMNSYVANDLSIDDDNSTVNLSGNYYGYSYNEENTENTTTADSDFSSAILVNGRNTTLKATCGGSSLESMILAGRSFVARKDDTLKKISSDIMMGESIALKSNQIAYLVPSEYVSVGHNPALSYEKATVTVDKAKLLASPIGTYLNSAKPFTANYLQNGYVYFYLNFLNENTANNYFANYYTASENMKSVLEKARTYISTTDDTGMQIDAALWLIAGNVIKNYKDNAIADLSVQGPNYFDGSNPDSNLLNDGKVKGKEYVSRQLTLLPGKGSTMRLPSDAKPLVADKIIDFSKVSKNVNALLPHIDPDFDDVRFVVAPSGYTIDSSSPKRGIIVANGVVNVTSDFEGLILSNQGVVVSVGGVTLKANITMVREMLKQIVADPELKKYFRGADSFDGNSDPDVSIADYISYSNWQKNSK